MNFSEKLFSSKIPKLLNHRILLQCALSRKYSIHSQNAQPYEDQAVIKKIVSKDIEHSKNR